MSVLRSRASSSHIFGGMALVLLLMVPGCGGSDSIPTESDPGTVSGTVTGPAGEGVAGASLSLATSGESTRTTSSGGNGSFTFSQVPAGSWTLSVDPPSGWELAPGQGAQQNVTVTSGGTAQASIQLVPVQDGGAISGTLLHDGWGVAEVELTLSGPGGTVYSAETGADGTFSFPPLEAGEWELEIAPPSWFELASGESAVRELTVESASIEVEVTLTPTVTQEIVEIEALGDLSFSPGSPTVAPGTRVRWVNEQSIFHTVTPSGHSSWTAGSLNSAGETFEVVFNNPGEFPYHCEPHQAQGMNGLITVEP